jgi:hypothetical protein
MKVLVLIFSRIFPNDCIVPYAENKFEHKMNLVQIGHKKKKIYFSVENPQCKHSQFPNKKIRLVLLRLAVKQHGAKQGHHQPLPRGRAH